MRCMDEPHFIPENLFTVRLSEQGVACERPDGKIDQVAWDDLERVEILTTADGPFAAGAFWVLIGSKSGCVIPWGATGDQDLLDELQALPDFDHLALVFATPTTEERRILCWERTCD